MKRRPALLVICDAVLIGSPSITLGVVAAVFDLQMSADVMRAIGELLGGAALVVAGWLYGRKSELRGLLELLGSPHFVRYTVILTLTLSVVSVGLAIAAGVGVSSASGVPFWGVALLGLVVITMNWAKVVFSMVIGAWLENKWGRSSVRA